MPFLFGLLGVLSLAAAVLAATRIASDIQIILVCVLGLGGFVLLGIAVALHRLNGLSQSNQHDAPASRHTR